MTAITAGITGMSLALGGPGQAGGAGTCMLDPGQLRRRGYRSWLRPDVQLYADLENIGTGFTARIGIIVKINYLL